MSEPNGSAPAPKRRRRKRAPRVSLETLERRRQLAERAQREGYAVELRLRGKGYQQIADQMGVTYAEAAELVQGSLKRDLDVDADKLDQLRQLEVSRLDRLWETWFPRASDEERPNMAAANLALKIAKRRAELLGLDRQQNINLNVNQISVSRDQLQRVVEMSSDPEAAAALERVAAMFAHGEQALDGEWEDVPPDGDD